MPPVLRRGETIAQIGRVFGDFGGALVTFAVALVELLPRIGNRVVSYIVYGSIVAVALYIFVVHGFAGAFVGNVQKGAEAILYPSTSGQEVKKELL